MRTTSLSFLLLFHTGEYQYYNLAFHLQNFEFRTVKQNLNCAFTTTAFKLYCIGCRLPFPMYIVYLAFPGYFQYC